MIRNNRQEINQIPYRDAEIRKLLPYGKYEYVDVTFPYKDVDVVIPYTRLFPEDPESIRFVDVNRSNMYTPGGITVPPGIWVPRTFNAGDWTATGGGSLTIGSGDIVTDRFTVVGSTVFFTLWIQNVDITGTVSAINVTMPGGFVCAYATMIPGVAFEGSTHYPLSARIAAGGTTIAFGKADGTNWTAGITNLQIRVEGFYETSSSTTLQSQTPLIYKATDSSRIQWKNGYVVLRSDTAGYSTRLMLFEERNE